MLLIMGQQNCPPETRDVCMLLQMHSEATFHPPPLFDLGSFPYSVVPHSVSKPGRRPQHQLRVSQHQCHHGDEVRGEAEVLTQPQNQY